MQGTVLIGPSAEVQATLERLLEVLVGGVARDTGINHEMRVKITAMNDETGEEVEASSGWREEDSAGTSLTLEAPGPYTVTVSSLSMDGTPDGLEIEIVPLP